MELVAAHVYPHGGREARLQAFLRNIEAVAWLLHNGIYRMAAMYLHFLLRQIAENRNPVCEAEYYFFWSAVPG